MKIEVNIRYTLTVAPASFANFEDELKELFNGKWVDPKIMGALKGSISLMYESDNKNDVTVHTIIENAKTFASKHVGKIDVLIQIKELKSIKEIVFKHKDYSSGLYIADVATIASKDQQAIFVKTMESLFDKTTCFLPEKGKLILIGKKLAHAGFESGISIITNLLNNQRMKFRSIGIMNGEYYNNNSPHQW